MPDLDERLRRVDDVMPPSMDWAGVERRALAPHDDRPAPSRRLGPALVALIVALAALVFMVRAFSGVGRAPATSAHSNGPIVFVDDGPAPKDIPFDNVDVYAWDPSTGVRTNLTNTPKVDEEYLSWSPDRSQVVFQRMTASGTGKDLTTTADLVLANADFSDQRVIRTCDRFCGLDPAIWSPDGSQLAWTGAVTTEHGGISSALQTYDLATGHVRTLCAASTQTCGNPGQPAWSPDGTEIAYSNAGSFTEIGIFLPHGPIWIADVASGQVHALTNDGQCNFGSQQGSPCIFDSSPQWVDDGQRVAFIRSIQENGGSTKSLMTVASDGTDERTLSTCHANDQCTSYALVASPDGTKVAFADRYDIPRVLVVDVTSGETSTYPLPADSQLSDISWSPDGSELAVLAGGRRADLLLIHLQKGTVDTVLPEATSQGELGWLSAGALALPTAEPAVSSPPPAVSPPMGTIVFSSSMGSSGEDDGTEIWSMRTDGSQLTQLTHNSSIDLYPALSPDGSKIAFSSLRPGDANTQVYVMNADGSDQHPITHMAHGAVSPAWSPDGTEIAFVSGGLGKQPSGVYAIETNGGEPWLVAEGPAIAVTWSIDSHSVIYSLGGSGLDGLWTAPTSSQDCLPGPCPKTPGTPKLLFTLPGSLDEPALSPDGKTLTFTWSSGSASGIYTSDLAGNGLQKVASGESPAWSPNGGWLAFINTDDATGPQIWAVQADGQNAAPLTSFLGFIKGTTIYGITRDPSWGR